MEAGGEAATDTESIREMDDAKEQEDESVRQRLRQAMAQLDAIEARSVRLGSPNSSPRVPLSVHARRTGHASVGPRGACATARKAGGMYAEHGVLARSGHSAMCLACAPGR
jgi:hypothetical protein